MGKTLFERIVAREIPATIIYEDELVLGIRDINPQARAHLLIFPRKAIPRIAEAGPEDGRVLAHLLFKAAELAEKEGLTKDGYRLVINNGPNGGETIPHLHVHVLGGRRMQWPPG